MTTAALEPKAEVTNQTSKSTMKALVYRTAGKGAGKPSWEDQPHPSIAHPEDAVVKITTTTICGTDLHILKGDLPAVTDGRILGHEGIGVIEKIGTGVTSFKVGDKIIISCVTACVKCDFCRKGMLSHCRHGG
jgi:alcohol dehydrogenase